jgi:diguanylate cyclase (GGDEF)-like protein
VQPVTNQTEFLKVTQLFSSVLNKFKAAPAVINKNELQEYFAILWTSIVVTIVHIVLFAVFLWQDVTTLAYFNIFSILSWLLVIGVNQKGKHSLAILIATFEILAHAIVVVSVLGLDYGFQMYLWPVACMVALNPRVNMSSALSLSVFCLILFVLMYGIFPARTSVEFFPDHIFLIFCAVTFSGGLPLVIGMMTLRTIYVRQRAKLEKMANFDMLTGLYNRRFFNTFLNEQKEIARKEGTSFCIALGDIDNFKSINDNYGHDMGDEVLVSVSALLSDELYQNGGLCRWGGEEFIVFLPQCKIASAVPIIDSIRKKLSESRLISDKELNVTMSFGLVEVNGAENIDDFVKRADELLYKAKDAGRNNVQI